MPASTALNNEQLEEFMDSSIVKPIDSHQCRNLIRPISMAILSGNLMDNNDKRGVYISLAKDFVVRLTTHEEGRRELGKTLDFAPKVKIQELRSKWGSASGALRVRVPLALEIPKSEKCLILYRVSEEMYSDRWIDEYFRRRSLDKNKKQFSKSLHNQREKQEEMLKHKIEAYEHKIITYKYEIKVLECRLELIQETEQE
jgi:hypothetical protein